MKKHNVESKTNWISFRIDRELNEMLYSGLKKHRKEFQEISRSSFIRKLIRAALNLVIIAASFVVTAKSVLASEIGLASYYGVEACRFNPKPDCPTASGESLYALQKKEKTGFRFAASWQYPIGTKVKVDNLANGKSQMVTICDRGPNPRLGRIIDVSRQTADDLRFIREGVTQVKVSAVSQKADKKGRLA